LRPPSSFRAPRRPRRTAPPTLGQHTDDILGSILGLDPAAIAQLRAQAVVA